MKRFGFLGVSLVACIAFLSGLLLPPFAETRPASISAQSINIDPDLYGKIIYDFYTAFPDQYDPFCTINEIRELHDFAGNAYYLVEFAPTGYSIYDETFEIPMERNAGGHSPYYGLFGDLIYGGATHYYVKETANQTETYQHTVRQETFEVDPTQKAELVQSSDEMLSKVNDEIVARKTVSKPSTGAQPNGIDNAEVDLPDVIRYAKAYDVDQNGDFIAFNNTNPGRCGFVAGALLVHYQRQVRSWMQFAPNGFTRQLVDQIQNRRDPDVNPWQLEGALNDYSYSVGRVNTVSMWYTLGAAKVYPSSIYDRVREGRPVILGGGLTSPVHSYNISHAVVITAVQRSYTSFLGIKTYKDYYFWAHYGWQPLDPNQPYQFNNIVIAGAAVSLDWVIYY